MRSEVYLPRQVASELTDDEMAALSVVMLRVADASGRSLRDIEEATYRVWGHLIALNAAMS